VLFPLLPVGGGGASAVVVVASGDDLLQLQLPPNGILENGNCPVQSESSPDGARCNVGQYSISMASAVVDEEDVPLRLQLDLGLLDLGLLLLRPELYIGGVGDKDGLLQLLDLCPLNSNDLVDFPKSELGLVVLDVVEEGATEQLQLVLPQIKVLYFIVPSLTLARVNSSESGSVPVPVPVDIFVNFVDHGGHNVDHGGHDGHCPPARRRPQSCR
jgi:hypothetical protein